MKIWLYFIAPMISLGNDWSSKKTGQQSRDENSSDLNLISDFFLRKNQNFDFCSTGQKCCFWGGEFTKWWLFQLCLMIAWVEWIIIMWKPLFVVIFFFALIFPGKLICIGMVFWWSLVRHFLDSFFLKNDHRKTQWWTLEETP